MIKVLVAGFMGSMGQKTVSMVNENDNFELVGAYSPNVDVAHMQGMGLNDNVKLFGDLKDIQTDADVWIDFTIPAAAFENAKFAIEHGIHPVVGTSGMSDDQVSELQKLAADKGVGGIIAPNFGLSAVLLMKFAKEAAKYMPDVEIIEMHHADKLDAPSGTALSTAKMIDEVRGNHPTPKSDETLSGVRGGDYNGIKIHSVRLPGYIAHEQVLFGGKGEALTIRQDSFDRGSFMNGVEIAVPAAAKATKLIVGLENIL
ncbi:MAG: 4-hydroxy-tetrahydrodipicolinate reductase [Lentilactobacillus diolivorans]|uniref:4-hydroxy-tetrahydrodipicolinate reductase n=2 Tax=Lentilactobacillus diolivorans TaxID=179838 RepID=A0A0R1S9K0_9LACO|nr:MULTISPECIES: 4-hydroxy-tetrahydrodipicolinate reductase [Lactobacillaceae]KRL62840.1 dihydrodipicolinate reductase [Lentilactobacillus diolivorans DSM 14421]MCS8573150.1 4-hydroxy-tetrahydrodipicolinate reductase [Pediococcus pentosaceus]MEB3376445.1 4-hydroxy-tetrahydrodipicolinate reductase [Pediococcus pentosaceus]GEP23427.1 4-hydroxy-tetrahydrodipicolinate reductase [Lentilactobacillus diolivorans]